MKISPPFAPTLQCKAQNSSDAFFGAKIAVHVLDSLPDQGHKKEGLWAGEDCFFESSMFTVAQ